LLSLVQSAQRYSSKIELTFISDGPISPKLEPLMRHHGVVRHIQAGNNRASFVKTVGYAAQAQWPDNDLVWFAEDDYLYLPEALPQLVQLRSGLESYVTVYATPLGVVQAHSLPGAAQPQWMRAVSTTSTFGLRVGALRQDRRLLQLAPWCGDSWDRATCLAVQGILPFPLRDIATDLTGEQDSALRRVAKVVGKPLGRVAVDVAALAMRRHRRHLLVSWPNLAAHLEVSELLGCPGDWLAAARGTLDWGREQPGVVGTLARQLGTELPSDSSAPSRSPCHTSAAAQDGTEAASS
jgi:hypothetical protein